MDNTFPEQHLERNKTFVINCLDSSTQAWKTPTELKNHPHTEQKKVC